MPIFLTGRQPAGGALQAMHAARDEATRIQLRARLRAIPGAVRYCAWDGSQWSARLEPTDAGVRAGPHAPLAEGYYAFELAIGADEGGESRSGCQLAVQADHAVRAGQAWRYQLHPGGPRRFCQPRARPLRRSYFETVSARDCSRNNGFRDCLGDAQAETVLGEPASARDYSHARCSRASGAGEGRRRTRRRRASSRLRAPPASPPRSRRASRAARSRLRARRARPRARRARPQTRSQAACR
ncbi:hypothetical protein T492DRAFT_1086842 [Pavlovales sp. CCMP2436]|nr:hypothetical protein T492DRAFT_1086842 [Pavlovales sp. CCMP2436]